MASANPSPDPGAPTPAALPNPPQSPVAPPAAVTNPPGLNPTEDALTLAKRWEMARELIEHEDNLVNHRIGWILNLQGFLFAALGLGASALVSGANKEYDVMIYGLLYAISLAGCFAPFLIMSSLKAARDQIFAVENWWELFGNKPVANWNGLCAEEKFPPIKGKPVYHTTILSKRTMAEITHGFTGPYLIPPLLGSIWFAVLLILFLHAIWPEFMASANNEISSLLRRLTGL